jgi:hypothetical protein
VLTEGSFSMESTESAVLMRVFAARVRQRASFPIPAPVSLSKSRIDALLHKHFKPLTAGMPRDLASFNRGVFSGLYTMSSTTAHRWNRALAKSTWAMRSAFRSEV